MSNPVRPSESALMDQVSLPGRKAELRQLLKALNLACTGQAKAVLVCGDEGIGKSTLIDAFLELSPRYDAQVVTVTCTPKTTSNQLFVSIVQAILSQADRQVQETLARINTHLAPLELQWTQADLLQMISLVGLQSAVSHEGGMPHEVISESILRNMPFTKRMNPQVRQQLLPAVSELSSPALRLAVSLMNPINPQVQEALDTISHSEYPATKPLHTLLSNLLNFINQGLQTHSSCLVLVIESWENLGRMDYEEAQEVKNFLNEVLKQTVEQRNTRLMVLLESRSLESSYTLGGSLYQALRVKLLLPPLPAAIETQRLKEMFSKLHLPFDEPVLSDMICLCQGNPAWLTLMMHRIAADYEQAALSSLSWDVYQERYAVKMPEDMVEFLFTRLQLAFVRRETEFLAVLEALVNRYAYSSFSIQEVTAGLSGRLDVNTALLTEVIDVLKTNHFLVESADGSVKQYRFFTSFLRDFLLEKFKPKAQPIPTPDKVASLKKILPLAIESGELTAEKLQEILAMARAMADESLLNFVEETIITSVQDSKTTPAQQMILLESFGLLATPNALKALLETLNGSNPELIIKGLSVLSAFVSRPHTGSWHQDIEATLLILLERDDPGIKANVLNLFIQTPFYMETLLPQLMNLMQDSNPEIAHFALAALVKKRIYTPEVLEALTQSLKAGPDPAMFGWILKGLEGFEPAASVSALTSFLKTNPQTALWLEALMLLSTLDLDAAVPWLSEILSAEGNTDQKLTILKRLGLKPHPVREKLLIDFLQPALSQDLRWMAIKSLGLIGQNPSALSALQSQVLYCRSDEILHRALENSIRQVSERVALSSAASKPHAMGGFSRYAPEPELAESETPLIELVAVDGV